MNWISAPSGRPHTELQNSQCSLDFPLITPHVRTSPIVRRLWVAFLFDSVPKLTFSLVRMTIFKCSMQLCQPMCCHMLANHGQMCTAIQVSNIPFPILMLFAIWDALWKSFSVPFWPLILWFPNLLRALPSVVIRCLFVRPCWSLLEAVPMLPLWICLRRYSPPIGP